MRLYHLKVPSGIAVALIAGLFWMATAFSPVSSFTYEPEVDVELVLAVDISQSMDDEEQEVQRDGYFFGHHIKGIYAGCKAWPDRPHRHLLYGVGWRTRAIYGR